MSLACGANNQNRKVDPDSVLRMTTLRNVGIENSLVDGRMFGASPQSIEADGMLCGASHR